MRNQVRGAVNTRKKMKTYSTYFMTYFIWCVLLTIVVILGGMFIWKEYKDGQRVHTNHERRIDALEAK